MDPVRRQYDELITSWRQVYETAKSNPAAVTPYLSNATPQQVNEVVETIGNWLNRVRAPQGYAPGFHVAKGLASTALSAASSSAAALTRGDYGHFSGFIVSLNQMLSSLHSMLVFSDKQKTRDAVAELGGKLSEALALLDSAQRELAAKGAELASADASLLAIQRAVSATGNAEATATERVAEIDSQLEAALEHLESIRATVSESGTLKEELDSLAASTQDLERRLAAESKRLTELNDTSRQQSDLITALLPKGASTGLASAFGARVGQLEQTKWAWAALFILSVVLLAGLAGWILAVSEVTSGDFWKAIAQRIPLAAPLVWLGWFSAIQYGNTLRVQEDYAFKEATSKAFAGYRGPLGAHCQREP